MQYPFIQALRNISDSNGTGIFISLSKPLLWSKYRLKVIHKTNEDPNFGHAEIEYETDNISRRYFDNNINKKGTNSSEGHFYISSETLGFLIKKKTCYILVRFYSF